MALFNMFQKKAPQKDIPDFSVGKQSGQAGVSLTKNPELNHKIDLRKQAIGLELDNQKISGRQARVVFVLDHSGSMSLLYKNGTVQETLERIFPLALTFDDNGEMEFYLFDNLFKELVPVNTGNLEEYTQKVIMAKGGRYGGTCYAPVIEEITARYGKQEPSAVPTFVIFITDGNNSDHKRAKDAIVAASHYNFFWKFVGIGEEEFEFLEKLDTMSGRFIDNANFVNVQNLASISDEQLYALLLEEFGEWQRLCHEKNLL